MKIRTLKKRIYNVVSDAVDHVYLDPEVKDSDKKIEDLLDAYDSAIEKANSGRSLKDSREVKAHFRELKSEFNGQIAKILG